MRATSILASLLLTAAVAACGSSNTSTPADAAKVVDAAKTVDAPVVAVDASTLDAFVQTGAFGCLGAALPGTAPDPLTLSGTASTVNLLFQASKAPGAVIQAYKGATATGAAATADANGAFSISIASGGMPVAAYLKGTLAGNEDFYLFPPAPVSTPLQNAPVGFLSASTLATVRNLAFNNSPPTVDATTVGTLILYIVDCNGAAVAGATVTATENGAPVGTKTLYFDNLNFNATQTTAKGLVVIFDVPPGTLTINSKVGTMDLRTNVVTVHAASVHAAQISP
jgi:hypothetical protein